MSTFLELTNKVLEKLNEIPLTTTTLSGATGFHSVAKEAVNNSIREINRESFEWPFNQQETTVALVAEQTFYNFPADAKVLDFDTFTIDYIRNGTTNYSVLKHVDYDWYIRYQYVNDKNLVGDPEDRLPLYVFKFGDQYGITPLPSTTDNINFTYWGWPDELVLDTDVCSISSRYDDVIIQGAIRECYDFRTMVQQAARYDGLFKAGIKTMRTLLLNDYVAIQDTRISVMG